MKYVEEMICFQEVPNETTLSFSISNCPHKCPGCHSSYLANDIGIPLFPVLKEKLDYHKGLITCVLFMGGDDPAQEEDLIKCIQLCQQYELKVAIYSGAEQVSQRLWNMADYIKVGPYIEYLGGLDHPTTNQRMYRKSSKGEWEDITSCFWKKAKED